MGSIRLLIIHTFILILFVRIRFTSIFIVSYLIIGIFFYVYAEAKLSTVAKIVSQETIFTWTSTYKFNGDKLRGFMVSDENEKWYITYTFSAEQEKQLFLGQSLTGAKYILIGQVDEVPQPAHDYSFNMQTYLMSHGAVGMFSATALQKVSEPAGIFGWIAERRFSMEKHIEAHFPSSLQAEAKALLLGLRDDVNQDETRAYQILGITHLFAISGLHVAFLTLIFYQSMLRLSIRKEVAVWCLLICLPVYACMVGGAPSVWRAVGVVEIILLSQQFHKRLALEDAFALSIIINVLLQPGVLLQIGFQLSYGATAALMFSSPFLKFQTTVLRQSFWITFLCQIGVAPIILFHFYEISLSSFVVNLLFIPLFTVVILPINLAVFLLSFILPHGSDLILHLYEPLRSALTICILEIASWPYQLWNPGKLSSWQLIVSYIGVGCSFLVLERQQPFKKMLLTLGIPVAVIMATPYFDASIEVTFLNVGQGDATIIELPHEQGVILIDAGGLLRFEQPYWKQSDSPFEIGREVVVPFLKGRGITNISTFIWTHADSDHIEGAEEILEEVSVEEIHVTPGAIGQSTIQLAVETALNQKISIKEQLSGTQWEVGDTQFTYVSPQDIAYEGNNDSLVLFMQHESFTALFTGDLEKEGEEEILTTYQGLQNITLLKAGHHGSKTSSSMAFLKRLEPELSVFSAGKNNRYGHPNPEVVKRFRDNHLSVLTTADVGSVHVRYHKEEMTIRTTLEKGIRKRDLSQ